MVQRLLARLEDTCLKHECLFQVLLLKQLPAAQIKILVSEHDS